MVSLEHLKNKRSRAQFLLYLKEKLLLMIFKSRQYSRNTYYILILFYNKFGIIKLQEIFYKYMQEIYSPNFQDCVRNKYTI